MSNPDCFSEKVGKFELKLISEKENIGLVQISRYKVSIIPDGEDEREILSCDDYCKACRLFMMIEVSGDWKNYQQFLNFLDGK